MLYLTQILGGVVGTLPSVYLGMPLGAKSKSKGIWNTVLENVRRSLSIGKANICPWVVECLRCLTYLHDVRVSYSQCNEQNGCYYSMIHMIVSQTRRSDSR